VNAPSYDPVLLEQLARVFAAAALEELLAAAEVQQPANPQAQVATS